VAYATERDLIMELKSRKVVRLYAVSEEEKNGKYPLEKFGAGLKKYNRAIDTDGVNLALLVIAKTLFFGCEYGDWLDYYVELSDGVHPDTTGWLCFNLEDGNRLTVPNIAYSIDVNREECRFFLLLNADRSACRWVVAVPVSNIYYSD
jgi:hypothetical protein